MMLHPLAYFSMYAGDAEIHLVYAEHAAQGNFFEFNNGEKSAGVTSPGYMLLLALLYVVFPATLVPLAVKLINIIFWYLFLYMIYKVAKWLLRDEVWGWTVTAVVALFPGPVYNATFGMENGIFAFLFIFFFYLTLKWDWHNNTSDERLKNFILGIILSSALWVRPEGFVVAFLAVLYKLYLLNRNKAFRVTGFIRSLGMVVYLVMPLILLGMAYFYFHFAQTGKFFPQSGMSRILMGGQESIGSGLLSINLKFTKYLIYYF